MKKGPSECGSGGEAAALPDVVNDEAGGSDEEVVHPVEAPADRLRVHRVVRDSSAGLINHLQHGGWRGRWAVNMSPINTSPASGFALIKIPHSVHLNSRRRCAVFLEMFRERFTSFMSKFGCCQYPYSCMCRHVVTTR